MSKIELLCRQPVVLSVWFSQDLLTMAESDLTKALDVDLGIDLCGVWSSMPDEIADGLE